MTSILASTFLVFVMVVGAIAQEARAFPREAAWPTSVRLMTATPMAGEGGRVTITKPAGTEVEAILSTDHTTVAVSLKAPDLRANIPIGSTDFMQQASEKEARMLEADRQAEKRIADEKAVEQRRLTDQFDASFGEAVNEKAIYGRPPYWSDNGISSPSVPTLVSRNLKKTLNDPASLKIRSVVKPVHAEFNGVKCWRLNFVFSCRNGFGGMETSRAVAWIKNDNLLELSVSDE